MVHPGLVEDEAQAAAAARQFNAEGVDIIVAMELAYTKGMVPARCLLDTTAPVLVWNTQRIAGLKEDDGFDVVMVNSGMAGMPELTAVLTRTRREFALVTSQFRRPAGEGQDRQGDRGGGRQAQAQDGPGRLGWSRLRGHDRSHV